MKRIKMFFCIFLALSAVFLLGGTLFQKASADDSDGYGVNLAFKRNVVASGHIDGEIKNINDENDSSRWGANNSSKAWFYIDLGFKEKFNKIYINWEASYATEYQLLASNDALSWTEIAHVYKDSAKKDILTWDYYIEAQFIKLQCISKVFSQYGISIYEFKVYGPKSLSTGSGVSVVEVSSYENQQALPENAMVDFDAKSRWASTTKDDQYFIVDLGQPKTFDTVRIRWEVSFARIYEIYIADTRLEREDEGWTRVYRCETGLGEVENLSLGADYTARFIKVELIQRETYEKTKKTGRYPWESTFSIYSFELYNWDEIPAVPVGRVMEFSKNAVAWSHMSNIVLNESGLILAPQGYPIWAKGKSDSDFASGNIPGFESYATYNPAVVVDDNGRFHMIYRTELPDNFSNYFGPKEGKGHMSTLSYAYSDDGVNWTRGENNPIIWPTLGEEKWGGTEDPRMFKIKDPATGQTTYYITYTMYNNSTTYQGMAYTTDFVIFTKVGNIAPGYDKPLKSGSYLVDPEGNAVMIDDPRPGKTGKVYVIFMKDGGYARIGFTRDVTRVQPQDIVDIDTAGFSDKSIEKITKGNESCVAVTNLYGEDDEEIILMYGGGVLSDSSLQYKQGNVNGWYYALGILKCTKSNPFELMNVKLDLSEPFMYPTDTNKIDYGLFDKCMFADTIVRYNGKWYFYYGAGDMYVGLATSTAGFSAGAADFEESGGVITASTYALNKKHGDDKTPIDAVFKIEVYSTDGTLLHSDEESYSVEHFSRLPGGIYDKGELISVSVDISSIEGIGDNWYIIAYVADAQGNRLNNASAHTKLSASVTHQ